MLISSTNNPRQLIREKRNRRKRSWQINGIRRSRRRRLIIKMK
jgi:hypothetical protein